MKHIINNILKALPILTAVMTIAAVLSSCNHKDLYLRNNGGDDDDDKTKKTLVNIHFNWDQLLPGDQKPEGMSLYFYNKETGKMSKYDIATTNTNDTPLEVPSGKVDIISYDCDADGITSKATDDKDNHVISTDPGDEVPAIYSEKIYDYEIVPNDGSKDTQVITITPKRIYKLYKITAINTDAIVAAAVWDGKLSGLTNSIYANTGKCAEDAKESKIEFPLFKIDETTSVANSIRTFGRLENTAHPSILNKLQISVTKTNNMQLYYMFDVTDQIKNAADPYNVEIVVDFKNAKPLDPTDPDWPDDGKKDKYDMNTGVDDYVNENIDIDMKVTDDSE